MAEAGRIEWRQLRVAALLLLAVKLVLLVAAQPFMDETYYFVWGQHPQLSYFDHPSLVGWAEGLSGALFGWTVLGLRAPVLLTLAGDLALLWLLARRRPPEEQPAAFWRSALLFLATPIVFGLSSVALPDHLLVLFTLATVYCVERLRETPEATRWIYLAAIAVGCTALSKYTGAMLGLTIIAYCMVVPRLQVLLRGPHLYLAIVVALAMQAPVLIWNMQHGLASFGFILGGRKFGGGINPGGVAGFLLGALAVLSPFILWPIVRFLIDRRDGHGYARLVFLISTLGFFGASLFTNILIHWNAIAYVAMLPFLWAHFRNRLLLWAQVAYGTFAIVLAGVNYAVLPLTALAGSGSDQTSSWTYGWDEIAAAVRAAQKDEPAGFIAATDYALASPLAFALHDPDVTSLSAHRDGYDDWFDAPAHKGESALVVTDTYRPLPPDIAAQFQSIVPIATVETHRLGYYIDRYTIYRGQGYLPPG
jgi:4-amino-4-deoxy-L-arabinose transferase-like glycosyltransferase